MISDITIKNGTKFTKKTVWMAGDGSVCTSLESALLDELEDARRAAAWCDEKPEWLERRFDKDLYYRCNYFGLVEVSRGGDWEESLFADFGFYPPWGLNWSNYSLFFEQLRKDAKEQCRQT